MDVGEYVGYSTLHALARHVYLDVVERLPLFLEQVDYVYRATAAQGGEHHLHGAHSEIVATDIGTAIALYGESHIIGGLHVVRIVEAREGDFHTLTLVSIRGDRFL